MEGVPYFSDEALESSADEEAEEQQALGNRQPRAIYKAEELHEKLEDISRESASFEDTRTTTCSNPGEVPDIEDDLQRELVFYEQALTGAREAVERMQQAGVPWQRPPDYYAEMVKSDAHMSRIKDQLMYEQRQIEEAEERRKQREAKKVSKEMQAERRKEKAQSKKNSITQVDKLRKQRQRSGFAGDLDMDAELVKMDRQSKSPAGQRISGGFRPVSRKREARNAKFGFGGRKRLGKQNDAKSAADINEYKPGGRRPKAGAGKNRPGKFRRAAARGKK